MADFHETVRYDMLQEPADTFDDVKVGSASAGTAHCPVGEGAHAVREADEPVVGDGDLEARGGEGGAGGVAMVLGLTVDVPGHGPHLGIDVLQQSGLAHGVFEEGAVHEREGFDGDQEGGAGGQPGRAILGEATAGHDVMEVGVVLELPAPRMQDTGETREVRPDDTRIFGEPFEGFRRGVEHGVVSEALMRAEKGAQSFRDGKGEEKVRSGELLLQVVLEPLLGFLLLTLGAVAVATGMVHAVLAPTGWALRQAVTVVSALALWDGADDLAVGEGQMGVALQVCGRKGGEDVTQGRHGRSPCMRALRRS